LFSGGLLIQTPWERDGRGGRRTIVPGGLVCGIEHKLALLDDGRGLAIVDHGGGEKLDAGMTVLLVVPSGKLLAKAPAILNGAEAVGKSGRYFRVRKWLSE